SFSNSASSAAVISGANWRQWVSIVRAASASGRPRMSMTAERSAAAGGILLLIFLIWGLDTGVPVFPDTGVPVWESGYPVSGDPVSVTGAPVAGAPVFSQTPRLIFKTWVNPAAFQRRWISSYGKAI